MIRPRFLVWIDRMFYPLVLFLNLFLWFLPSPSIKNNISSAPFVIIKMMGIGSITRIYAILKQHKVDFSKVHFYTLSANKELCQLLRIPNVHFFEVKAPALKSIWVNFWGLVKMKPKYLINYERTSNIISIFCGLATVFSRNTTTISFENQIKDKKNKLGIQYYLRNRPIEKLISLTIPYFPKSKDPIDIMSPLLCERKNKFYVLVNVNASDYLPQRKYPLKSFAESIRLMLAKQPLLDFFLIGSSNEKEYVQKMINLYLQNNSQIHNYCGIWNLKELSYQLANANLLITNDSGPMNLAMALSDIQVLSIWGPTSPYYFGYLHHPRMTHLSSQRACFPCFIHPKSRVAGACKGKVYCMRDISPKKLADVALSLLR